MYIVAVRIIRFIASGDSPVHFGEDHADGTATALRGSIQKGFQPTRERLPIAQRLAPIEPTDIICIGRNYHAPSPSLEGGGQVGEAPRRQSRPLSATSELEDSTLEVFLKPSTALQAADQPIVMPRFEGIDVRLDCEGELALVIGRETRNVSEANALDHVFGYTIVNDITARHFQTPTGPPLWMRGKGFDTFCPLGPAIVTVDELADPDDLNLRTLINGKVVREGNTRDMIRSVPQIIAALSRHITLRAGAVILTGAPPVLDPSATGPFGPGNEVVVEIEGIGELRNIVGA
jgi:2-keto-4-pentenoate hydratase/2-oxohepta-3-ene-1,7-dioic acid hydratase in catechol pathway